MYDLKKHFLADKKIILSKIENVLSKGVLEMGEEVEKFEENFKKYCNVKYCVTVSSGSMGLLLALKTLDLKKNDEVITVSNSDIPTSHAITLVGAKIKWVDINEDFLNIDEKDGLKNQNVSYQWFYHSSADENPEVFKEFEIIEGATNKDLIVPDNTKGKSLGLEINYQLLKMRAWQLVQSTKIKKLVH